jgi:hypothetical protein
MVNFFDLYELANIKAIGLALQPTPSSVWQMKCREYSQKFSTPLHVVYTLDPQFILDNLYQEKYHPSIVTEESEDLLNILYKIKDPNYQRISVEETEALVDAVLNREIARASKRKAPTMPEITSEIKASKIKTPKSGGINFSKLEELEAKENNGGFKDETV